MPDPASRVCWRIEIRGVVQGVGFRPFVYRMATELGLDGVVGNDAAMVFVEIGANEEQHRELLDRIASEAPPLAVIESIVHGHPTRVIERGSGFVIVASETSGSVGSRTFVSPDTGVCDDCLTEFGDPSDRRYGHPFINCTNCGPRFTITRSLPYDRASTTMDRFAMCSACRIEYEDPTNRRFHAQPIGCHECGPVLAWQAFDDSEIGAPPVGGEIAPVPVALARLAAGGVVGVKGLGGFHLAALATSDAAVATLRSRKHRPDKPFAVMVADLEQARTIADVTDPEAELLSSAARPIVLCRARSDSGLSKLVAPANPLVGIMLPYTPIHHLLLGGTNPVGPLVMTSANHGGEPICYRDEQVAVRLAPLADGILTHDRPIHVPCDDSVVRVTKRGLLPIRRARGYAPMPVMLGATDEAGPSILAVGGELKNAFCITNGRHAWMSQHIGDMENLETLEAFEASVDQFRRLYGIVPQIVAADTHPSYHSSEWARTNHGDRVVEVQHHHAHVAAVMAEHGLIPSQPVLGVAFDGTGHGTDGTIWGGELLVATAHHAQRVEHLRPIPLPGGDAAIRHPWRVALSHLRSAGIAWDAALPSVRRAGEVELGLLSRQLDRNLGCVPTTSMGRLFDALASLTGIRHDATYEAQAAIEFEIAAASWSGSAPEFTFSLSDPTPLLSAVCAEVLRSTPADAVARSCHLAIAGGVARRVVELCGEHVLDTVVLSGGVFQNVLLTEMVVAELVAAGLDVLTHSLVPPNDGGLALGQAFVAHARAIDPQVEPPSTTHCSTNLSTPTGG